LKELENMYKGVDLEEYNALKAFKQEVEDNKMQSEPDAEKVKEYRKKIKRELYEATQAEIAKKEEEIAKVLEDKTAIFGELYNLKVKNALLTEAANHKAVFPEQVATLLSQFVKLDDNRNVVVYDSDGEPATNMQGDPKSIAELVEEYMAKYTNLRQSSGRAGSDGAQTRGNQQNTMTGKYIGSLSPEEYARQRPNIIPNVNKIRSG
jgi:hypothetical protein